MQNTLTQEEEKILKDFIINLENGEMAQVRDLMENCDVTYQFAKTHSNYVKDWEKTKQQMEGRLETGNLPPNTSANLWREMINESDKIMQKKFQMVQGAFSMKFDESIFNYLGPDGKTKKIFGIFG